MTPSAPEFNWLWRTGQDEEGGRLLDFCHGVAGVTFHIIRDLEQSPGELVPMQRLVDQAQSDLHLCIQQLHSRLQITTHTLLSTEHPKSTTTSSKPLILPAAHFVQPITIKAPLNQLSSVPSLSCRHSAACTAELLVRHVDKIPKFQTIPTCSPCVHSYPGLYSCLRWAIS